jgi:4-diphosphocytidyl-2-C-methyl-D-erythritol kinase
MGADLVIQAPAKLNLFLEVLAKRSDGFHEIETLMLPVHRYDTLYFRDELQGHITLRCEFSVDCQAGLDEPFPRGADNLVVRAVELLRRKSGLQRGATMRLIKRIPAGAGLAGGSSDAAAALVAANHAWRLGYPRSRLAELGAELGSDVPFFLGQGPAVCRGRGERVAPVERIGSLYFVVARPPAGLSTAAVYQACEPAKEPYHVDQLQTALANGDWRAIGGALHNRLQSAARHLCPWIGRLEEEFEKLDVIGHRMSGSGSGYFGICRTVKHARGAAGRLRARGVGQVFTVSSIPSGFANCLLNPYPLRCGLARESTATAAFN